MGECTNKNGCVVQTMMGWGLGSSVYTSDKQVMPRPALAAEAIVARLLKFQLRKPPGGILIHSSKIRTPRSCRSRRLPSELWSEAATLSGINTVSRSGLLNNGRVFAVADPTVISFVQS